MINNQEITLKTFNDKDYICISDIARLKNNEETAPSHIIRNWMRSKNTIEFLIIWERLNNTNFNLLESEQIKNLAGSHSFTISFKEWIDKTKAIELIS